MKNAVSPKLLSALLSATDEQRTAAQRLLEGQPPPAALTAGGALLLRMHEAAKLVGVSRSTFWRIVKSGRLEPVEIMPGTFRVRRLDIERLAGVTR